MATQHKAAFDLVGFSARTNNAVEMRGGKIGPMWGSFMESNALAQIPDRIRGDEIRAAYIEYESDHTGEYTFVLGAAVKPGSRVPDGMVRKTIPAAKYAVFTAASPAQVPSTWQTIWAAGLKRTYTGDFEVSTFGAGGPPRIEIFVAVE